MIVTWTSLEFSPLCSSGKLIQEEAGHLLHQLPPAGGLMIRSQITRQLTDQCHGAH